MYAELTEYRPAPPRRQHRHTTGGTTSDRNPATVHPVVDPVSLPTVPAGLRLVDRREHPRLDLELDERNETWMVHGPVVESGVTRRRHLRRPATLVLAVAASYASVGAVAVAVVRVFS